MGNLEGRGGWIIHTFEWYQWAEESSQDRIFLTLRISFSGLRASSGTSWSWDITGLINTIHESKNNTGKVSQLCEERENTLSNPQNVNVYYVFTQQHQKWVFLAAHTLNNPKNDFPTAHTFRKTQNEFPAMGKMEKSAKIVKGNT